VTEGVLDVAFSSVVQYVVVTAIEVEVAGSVPPTPDVPLPPLVPADHFAHAVIGDIPKIIDVDGDWQQEVVLTYFGSHTHRFVDGVADSLVRATWFNKDTEVVLQEELSILTTLPLGSTKVCGEGPRRRR